MFILLLFEKEAAKICELQICDMTTQSSTTAHDPATWPQPFNIHHSEAKPHIPVKQTLRCLHGALNLLPLIKGKDNRLKAFPLLYNCVNLESTMLSSHLAAGTVRIRPFRCYSILNCPLQEHKIVLFTNYQNLLAMTFDLKENQKMQRF